MSGYISETKALIAGREEEIIRALGIDLPRDGTHRRCPLPSHDDHNPSWRWERRKARSHCTCEEGRGDVLDLVMHMRGCADLLSAADWARQMLGLPDRNGRTETPAERRAREVRVAEARRLADERQAAREREDAERNAETVEWIRETLWGEALNAPGTLVETYLRSRGITCRPPAPLGFLEEYGKERLPAMIAAFGMPTEPEPGELQIRPDDITGIHLTLLRPDGSGKAADAEGRSKIIIGRGHSMPIVLAPPDDRLALAIGEGIEKCLAWYEAEGWGCWAAGTANRLPGLAQHIPGYIECVNIIEDADPAGQRYTQRLRDAILERGSAEVNILRRRVSDGA